MRQLRPHQIEAARRIKPEAASNAKLFAALASARGEFPDIPRTRIATVRMKSGGQYSYKYADLADVLAAVTPALSANGLAVMQYPDGLELVTILAHASGETLQTIWPIKALPLRGLDDSQSFQSAVQVAKRYALTALLGVSTEETIEGDPKAHRREAAPVPDENFHTPDGVRAPVGAKFTAEMTPRQKAEEAARAIEALFQEPKTAKGLEGVWNRNSMFIERLRDHHADLFNNVYDVFCLRQEAIEGNDE